MDESQIQLIKDKTYLEIRAKVAEVLLEQGILDTFDGRVGCGSIMVLHHLLLFMMC